MKRITPRDFRNAFVEVMKAEHTGFRTAVGFEAKSYTYYMRSNIFPKIAKQLVIFGTPGTDREWRFYAYESDGFVLMLPG